MKGRLYRRNICGTLTKTKIKSNFTTEIHYEVEGKVINEFF